MIPASHLDPMLDAYADRLARAATRDEVRRILRLFAARIVGAHEDFRSARCRAARATKRTDWRA